jgi:hypothetical protein
VDPLTRGTQPGAAQLSTVKMGKIQMTPKQGPSAWYPGNPSKSIRKLRQIASLDSETEDAEASIAPSMSAWEGVLIDEESVLHAASTISWPSQ